MDDQTTGWIDAGSNAFQEEPEESIFFMRARGDITVEEARRIAGAMQRFLRDGRDHLFVLIDLTELGDLGVDARKALADLLHTIPIRATAGFGASFSKKVIATLADRLTNVLRGDRRYKTRVFPTEAKARAWLAEERLRLAKPST